MLGNNCLCGNFPVLACLFLPAESLPTLAQFGWRLVWTWNTKTQTCRSWPHSHQILLKWTFQSKGEQNSSLAAVGDLLEPRENKWLRSTRGGRWKERLEKTSQFVICFLSLVRSNLSWLCRSVGVHLLFPTEVMTPMIWCPSTPAFLRTVQNQQRWW